MNKILLILSICTILGACASTTSAVSDSEPLLTFNTLAEQIHISREQISDADELPAAPVQTAMTNTRSDHR